MGILKEMDGRFVNLERKIGLFVITIIAGIALLVVLIGLQRDLFVKKTRLIMWVENGSDITPAMAVKLSGFKIGKVERLELDDVAMVKVELSINKNFMKWIKTDSQARLVKEGMIGDSIIEITPGSRNEVTQMEENDVISFERERGLSEMAEEVSGEVKKLMSEVRDIVVYINDPKGDVKTILGNLSQLSAGLINTEKRLATVLGNVDNNLSGTLSNADALLISSTHAVKDVNNIVVRLAPLIESAEGAAAKVDASLPDILEKVDGSLKNLEEMTADLKKAVKEMAPQIPVAAAKGEKLLDDADEIAGSLKKTWPIRSNIPNEGKKMLSADSYE